MIRRFAVLWIIALLAGSLQAEDKEMGEQMEALDDARAIKAGDFLSLQIRKMGLEVFVARVEDNGEFSPPFLAPMKVAEMSCRELAYLVKRELEKNYLCGTQWVLVKFASSQEFMNVMDDKKVIRPGDKLTMRILEAGSHVDDLAVAEDGTMMVRDVGQVKAMDLTCKKLGHLIRQKLAALPAASLSYQYSGAPTVSVMFASCEPKKVQPTMPPSLR